MLLVSEIELLLRAHSHSSHHPHSIYISSSHVCRAIRRPVHAAAAATTPATTRCCRRAPARQLSLSSAAARLLRPAAALLPRLIPPLPLSDHRSCSHSPAPR
ncbi:UNVERIFIED_CONTAM: hypothetical protein Sradi_3777100 [Sesamum radiatum]|uniref:Uncharacterized protein n=1 Tax=Sesamum radiatum TaxID=300843 RepID=A0AAW2PZG6_SESRA